MSSVIEQLIPPPKQKLSPLEFRNTDLVSRLLAATPPYLYNMSLLPNTYFFSEMLRSFVQAKSDVSTRQSNFSNRRARKRPWPSKIETNIKSTESSKLELPDWQMKSFAEHKTSETPLELTTSKLPFFNNERSAEEKAFEQKVEMSLPDPIDPMFSSMSQDASNLILPPPPPMWYPPLYPSTTPYGIDPLHFFIDLRVSGHIYDRKNQDKETGNQVDLSEDVRHKINFKQRHSSAFSVPIPSASKSSPMNLSHLESKNIKFDVKSMGFEKPSNKIGTNYILNNINNIYSSVNAQLQHNVKSESSISETQIAEPDPDNETEEERQKRVKDLRALIGLELVVDYMNHAKPQPRRVENEQNFTINESAGSPTLEVVALQEEA